MPVYNFAVDGDPEYFANGVLVHNCDAMRYAAAYVDDLGNDRADLNTGGYVLTGNN